MNLALEILSFGIKTILFATILLVVFITLTE